jgi:Uma2 family endonuclease
MTEQTIATHLTAEEFMWREDFDGPVGLIEGTVIEMPPPSAHHGVVCLNLASLLKVHALQHGLGHVFSNDGSVITERGPDTVRGADIGFVSYEKIPQGQFPKQALRVPPDLVVEVRFPSGRWRDITKRVLEYLDAGVTVVCVLDPTTETGRIYRSDRQEEQLKNGDLVRFDDVLPGFSVPLKQLFE